MSLQDTAPEPKAKPTRAYYGKPFNDGFTNRFPGMSPRQARLMRLIEGTTEPAIKRLIQLMQSENEDTSLRACRELLNRALGMPSQRVTGTIEVSADAHVRALLELARRSRDTAEMRVIEASPSDVADAMSAKPSP